MFKDWIGEPLAAVVGVYIKLIRERGRKGWGFMLMRYDIMID